MNLNINTFYGIFAILLWSTTVAIVRSITGRISAIQTGAITFSTSGAICILYMLVNKNFDSIINHPTKYLLICGLLFVVYTVALFVAIECAANNQQAMEIGLINYLWPTLTVMLSLVLVDQSVSFLLVPGILLALFGVFIVISQESIFSWKSFIHNIRSNADAYLAALIAAITWAIYSNLTNLWANPNSASAVIIFIPFTGLVFVLFSILSSKKTKSILVWEKKTILELLYFSISTILSYIFWDISMRRANVSFVAILSYFTPFFSTLIVGFYHKETLAKKLWLGCFMISAGSLLSWISIY